MKDISDLEFMINSLYKKWKYHVGHTYEWQKKNEAMFNDIVARLEALERRTYESDEGGVMTDQEPIKSPSIPADRYQYEIPKIQQVFCHWWKTRQSVLGDFSPEDAAFEAFKFGIYEEGKGTFDPEPCQQVPTDKELSIDDLDEFTIYWWGPDVDGKRSLADAIESGRMSEFVRTVLTRY